MKTAILVELDYKGYYGRFALTEEEFKKFYPNTYKNFGCDEGTDTLRPFVHIWFKKTRVGSEDWINFFTDMSWGLPESDVENENLAYVKPENAIAFRNILLRYTQYNEKHFLDLEIGDKVLCLDEYSGGASYHILKINSVDDDAAYATETNPMGRRYFGTDQEYLNKNGEFEEGDYEYLSVVDEGNFVYVVKEK